MCAVRGGISQLRHHEDVTLVTQFEGVSDIQRQLSLFSVGMAENMSKLEKFTNMEGAVMQEDL